MQEELFWSRVIQGSITSVISKQVLTWRGSCCGPGMSTTGKNEGSRRSAQAFSAVGAPQFFQSVYYQKVQNSICCCSAAGSVHRLRYWALLVAQKLLKMFWYHYGKTRQSSCQWLQVHKLLIGVVKGSWWSPSSALYLAHQVGKFLFSPRGLCRAVCSSGFTLVKKSLRRKNNLAEIVRQIQHTSKLPERFNTLFPMQDSSEVYEQNGSSLFLWAPGQAFERCQHEKQGYGSFSDGFAAWSLNSNFT